MGMKVKQEIATYNLLIGGKTFLWQQCSAFVEVYDV